MGENNTQSFKRGVWSAQEDEILINYVQIYGEKNWNEISRRCGLKRKGKSCRLRWRNYLKPDIKRGNISEDEEDLIIRLHKLLGNRWALIAGRLPGRTDNEIKNYWNCYLKKKAEEKKTIVVSKEQFQIRSIQETQCNSRHAIENGTQSFSSSLNREDLSNLLVDVDFNEKWWDRCYEHVLKSSSSSSSLLSFPESTVEAEIDVFKDNIEFQEYGNPINLENLSEFLGLD